MSINSPTDYGRLSKCIDSVRLGPVLEFEEDVQVTGKGRQIRLNYEKDYLEDNKPYKRR